MYIVEHFGFEGSITNLLFPPPKDPWHGQEDVTVLV